MNRVVIALLSVTVFLLFSVSIAFAKEKANLGQCIRECVQNYNYSLRDSRSGADEHFIDGFKGKWCEEFCKYGATEDSCYPFEDGCCNTDYESTDPDCQVVAAPQLWDTCDTANDLCADGLVCAPEFSGTKGFCSYQLPLYVQCTADYQCASSICNTSGDTGVGTCSVPAEYSNPGHCEDSDGGINYSVKGITSGNHVDTCTKDINYAPGVFYYEYGLMEMYCDGDSTKTTLIVCKNGCEDGACLDCTGDDCVDTSYFCKKDSDCAEGYKCDINSSIGMCRIPANPYYADCVDSDGGNDPFTFGVVTYRGRDGQYGEAEDYCTGDKLTEFVCDFNGYPYNGDLMFQQCPNGCANGACY